MTCLLPFVRFKIVANHASRGLLPPHSPPPRPHSASPMRGCLQSIQGRPHVPGMDTGRQSLGLTPRSGVPWGKECTFCSSSYCQVPSSGAEWANPRREEVGWQLSLPDLQDCSAQVQQLNGKLALMHPQVCRKGGDGLGKRREEVQWVRLSQLLRVKATLPPAV